jgi:hypothetical protein
MVTALIGVVLAALSLPCWAESACGAGVRTAGVRAVVRADVEAAPGTLTLADLLAPGTCPQLFRQAAQVSLGAAPRAGSVRVLDGSEVRRLIEGVEDRSFGDRMQNSSKDGRDQIPERVLVRQAEAVKSCAEIGRFIAGVDRASPAMPDGRRWENLDCAAARNIREGAPLELVKATWNAGLERREFALRCSRAEDCIPFLVWSRDQTSSTGVARSPSSSRPSSSSPSSSRLSSSGLSQSPLAEGRAKDLARLIQRGQTALLTWEQAGIRIVAPVTCLEAGGIGEFVRVRFKHAPRTLRAEIVGAGRLRASL